MKTIDYLQTISLEDGENIEIFEKIWEDKEITRETLRQQRESFEETIETIE